MQVKQWYVYILRIKIIKNGNKKYVIFLLWLLLHHDVPEFIKKDITENFAGEKDK